jgi:hypothetical protein
VAAFVAEQYGFGPVSDRVVVVDGRPYPAKAILGAAHGHQYPDVGRLADSDFVRRQGTDTKPPKLGFEVRR